MRLLRLPSAILLLLLTMTAQANDDCIDRSELLKLKSAQEKLSFPDGRRPIEISYVNNDALIDSKSGLFNLSIKGEKPKYRTVDIFDRTSLKNKNIENNIHFRINLSPRNEDDGVNLMTYRLIPYAEFSKFIVGNCFLSIGKTKAEQEDYLKKNKSEKKYAEWVKKNELISKQTAAKNKLEKEKAKLEREKLNKKIAENKPENIRKAKLEEKLKNPIEECEKLNDYSGERGGMGRNSEGLSVFLRRKDLISKANPEKEKENLKASAISDDFMIDGNKGYFSVQIGQRFKLRKIIFEDGKAKVSNEYERYENEGLEIQDLKKIIRYPCFIKVIE